MSVALLPIMEQSEIAFLDSVKPEKYEAIICLYDSCGIDYVEYMQNKYPFIGGVHNTGRPFGLCKLLNVGLKLVMEKFKGDIHLINTYDSSGVLFPRQILEKIGYLDEAFPHYGALEDFSLRAKLAGFNFSVKADQMTEFAAQQLLYKWNQPRANMFNLDEFYNKVLTEYTFNDSMVIR
jgi:hypothetical protein